MADNVADANESRSQSTVNGSNSSVNGSLSSSPSDNSDVIVEIGTLFGSSKKPDAETNASQTETAGGNGNASDDSLSELELPSYPAGAQYICTYVNGRTLPYAFAAWVGDVIYLPVKGFCDILGGNVNADVGDPYIESNGRYIPLSSSDQGVKVEDFGGVICASAEALVSAAGIRMFINDGALCIAGAPTFPTADETYDQKDLYWLSHIISAESGLEPMEGQLAVGAVVLNRVKSELFPSSIYSVIFQQNQFSPAASGGIYKEPKSSSVIAAKLCLEGFSLSDDILFFFNPSVAAGTWIKTRQYVMTIGGHDFYA